MTDAEGQVAAMFAAIRRDDPGGSVEQFGSLASAHQYRRLYELTGRHVSAGARVLDWGCGRGHFSYFLAKAGFRVTAYSLEHPPEIFDALSDAERRRVEFVRGGPQGARTLPFSDGEFAAAFSVGVLEHVREMGGEERASLCELRRVLRRDGVFVCYHLPNRLSYIEALSRWLGNAMPDRDFHQYRFTTREIQALCQDAGLRLVDRGRYAFLPRNSLNRLPGGLRASQRFATALNRSDEVLERLFSPFVQNYYFVARPSRGEVDNR